jgi:hypothetical protein
LHEDVVKYGEVGTFSTYVAGDGEALVEVVFGTGEFHRKKEKDDVVTGY